ncbi:MAG: M3 family oligoendopeptidase [Bacilli bacterium]
MEWNLEELFKTENDFYNEIENIKRELENIKQYENIELNKDNLLELLNKKWELKEKTNNVLVYGSLNYYKNIKSEEMINLKTQAEKLNSEVESKLSFIDLKILEPGKEKIEQFIKENNNLKTYELYINNLFRMQEHIQDEETNNKIKQNNNRINELLTKYNTLISEMKFDNIEENGEQIEVTNSNYSKLLQSNNENTRRQAYLSVDKRYKEKQIEFFKILKEIYELRIQNSKLENYDSVLEKVLMKENIDKKIIDTLIKSVNNNLSLIHKYLKIKSNLNNIENPHIYDFGIQHNLEIEYPLEEAINIIKETVKQLGQEYIDVVNILLNGHIDTVLDENKHQSITFSWHTYSFLNYKNRYIDLKNLIHELGHIVNYYMSKQKQPFIYEDSTIFVGETASITNEILLNRYLQENSKTKEEEQYYLIKQIENYFLSVYKQTMYTEFESKIYELINKNSLTPQTINEEYMNLIKKYYGDNIDYSDASCVEWIRLGHLFRWSYYPYKYATGLMISSILVDELLDTKTLTKAEYIDFLSSGSNAYSLDLLKKLRIDLTNNEVIENGFKVLEKSINKL